MSTTPKDGLLRLDGLGHGQRDRLAFIEFRLMFTGEVNRTHVSDRFRIALSGVSRDLALYKEIAPKNLMLDGSSKTYRITPEFAPVFRHDPKQVLSSITQGVGASGVANEGFSALLPCEYPAALSLPTIEVLAPICRAIYSKTPVSVMYHSMSSEPSQRVLIPFAVVDTGLRWHVRAFDRKSGEFRDFVLTRMTQVQAMPHEAVAVHERSDRDIQWTRVVELALIPHPRLAKPQVIEMDYAMQEGFLTVRARAAVAGYMLLRWGVDCSTDRHLQAEDIRLALRDPMVLYGVANATLTPGYQKIGGRHE